MSDPIGLSKCHTNDWGSYKDCAKGQNEEPQDQIEFLSLHIKVVRCHIEAVKKEMERCYIEGYRVI